MSDRLIQIDGVGTTEDVLLAEHSAAQEHAGVRSAASETG
jgi:hypothetical protein